jgi:tRNA(fMet)-specific endonuclease VapC
MTYLLDTNTCINYLNRRGSPIKQRLPAVPAASVQLCSIVKAELYDGAYRSSRREQNLVLLKRLFGQFASVPFDDAAAESYGRIRAELSLAGTLIGPNDLMIAAIALAHGLTLVTHNTREFSRVAGLAIEDWEASEN